jgi:hypothetical protein
LNLTAKSILQQFEVSRKKKTGDGDGDGNDGDDGDGKKSLNKAMNELLAMANEIEDEPSGVDDVDENSEGDFEDSNEEGLEDERHDLSAGQIAELEADLLPVRLMLTKVWTCQMTKKNSHEIFSFEPSLTR